MGSLLRPLLIAAVLTLPSLARAADSEPGDVAKGQAIFTQQCAVCHSVVAGDTAPRPGPNLHGVIGRKAAALPGFAYSPALKASGLSWDRRSVERFLMNPANFVPGTKMQVAIPAPGNRQNLSAYLASVSK